MKNKNKQTKFPVARIKKIMQKDEEVGKVAQATPVVISKALELFLGMIVQEAANVTIERGSKRVETYHLKHAVERTDMLDFLKEIVSSVPDPSAGGTIDIEAEKAEGKRRRNANAAARERGDNGHGEEDGEGEGGAVGVGKEVKKRRRRKTQTQTMRGEDDDYDGEGAGGDDGEAKPRRRRAGTGAGRKKKVANPPAAAAPVLSTPALPDLRPPPTPMSGVVPTHAPSHPNTDGEDDNYDGDEGDNDNTGHGVASSHGRAKHEDGDEDMGDEDEEWGD